MALVQKKTRKREARNVLVERRLRDQARQLSTTMGSLPNKLRSSGRYDFANAMLCLFEIEWPMWKVSGPTAWFGKLGVHSRGLVR